MGNKNTTSNETVTITDEYINDELRETVTASESFYTVEPKPEQKRGRGRPKGSGNKNKFNNRKETISLQEEKEVNDFTSDFTNKATENIKNSSGYKGKNKKGKLYTPDEAIEASTQLLAVVESLAVGLVGNEASFNPVENTMLQLSLPKYLETLDISAVDKTSKILYPLIGLVGISMYSLRVANIILDKRKENKKVEDELTKQVNDNLTANKETTQQYNDGNDNTNYKLKGDEIDWNLTKNNNLKTNKIF